MDVLAGVVIMGTLMGIAAMALVAWVGETLLQRFRNRGDHRAADRPTGRPGPLPLVSSGQGKHRPAGGGPRIAA